MHPRVFLLAIFSSIATALPTAKVKANILEVRQTDPKWLNCVNDCVRRNCPGVDLPKCFPQCQQICRHIP
ncbi:hypothetical protein VTJ83DRAFT_2849 [Remersonia thermophila]|uniref:Uncharacterized protein n=1 Tax=Remersonia thermophila TaxID=72144 RepID=A0ABR4DCE4_9PEZI